MTTLPTASKDPLTRLPDRYALLDLLPKVIVAEKQRQSKFALLVIDIKGFHRINSIYGLKAGDVILKKMADLLQSVQRRQDYLLRMGDNRFALVLMDVMNAGHAELAARKIQHLLASPFLTSEDKIKLQCTVGIALFPQNAVTAEGLIKDAEDRLYEARKKGMEIGGARKSEADDPLPEYWEIEVGLQTIIEKQQLQLYYQPQISLDTRLPIGAEALVRWLHPKKGLIGPDVFIPIAERTGHISEITNWVLNRAMRESAMWTDHWGPLTVSVNIPPDFILQPLLKNIISSAVKLWGGDNITLVLEIIERSLIKEPQRCFEQLTQIQEMGVQVSIDDFGTGYSTLSYFRHIPVNELKIDQSFVIDLLESRANQNIVRLITDLAHSFDMKVVAEGIESAAVMEKVKSYGVDVGQGYYFAKPMPDKVFRDWLLDYRSSS